MSDCQLHFCIFSNDFLGPQLHLSKQKLEDIKKCFQSQCPDIPDDVWNDSKLLVTLLPSIIDMGYIGIDELLQLPDEVLTGKKNIIICSV